MNYHTPHLRKILSVATVLFISGILLITSYSLWRLKAETETNMLEISAMHSHNFESFLTQNLRLSELATINIANMDTRKKNIFNIERIFINTLRHNPTQRSISLLDENNRIIASSNRANTGITINTQGFLPLSSGKSVLRIGEPWSGRDFANGKPSTHETPFDGNQLNFIPVIYTLVNGERVTTLLIAINPDFFINYISGILNTEAGIVEVIRDDGTLLLSTDPNGLVGALYPFKNKNTEHTITGQYHGNYKEQPALTSFRASDRYFFTVFTHINQEYAVLNWQTKAKTLISVIMLMLICLAILTTIFYRRQKQFAMEHAESERLQRINSTVFGSSADSIIIADINANIISINPAFSRMTGYSAEEVIGRNPRLLSSGEQDQAFYKEMWECINENGVWSGEFVNRCKDGRLYVTYTTITSFCDSDGHLQHFISVGTDITERKKSETRLQQAASVFLNSQEGIMVTDAQNRIIDVNPAFSHITGYSYSDVYGQKPNILSSGRQTDAFYREMNQVLTKNGSWQGEIWNRKKSGEVYAERLSIDAVRAKDGQVIQYVGVFSDISRIKVHEEELHRIAHYDPLTGIPNRRLLSDRLHQSISRTKRTGTSLAICYLDLDGFKPVNDQFGHPIGDILLIEVTNRLLKILRAEDTLARLGGDEFVILFSDLHKPEEIDVIITRVLASINEPIFIEEHTLNISASIGVTLFPADTSDADTLLRHADQAMYKAKDAGKNCYHLFDPSQSIQVEAHKNKLKNIKAALDNNEFVLYYQPKVNLVSGEVIGAEALIRWQHPEQGILPPAAFLYLIDGDDLEIELGEWVIESVIKQIECWNKEGLFFTVSANLTANHLLQFNFTQRLKLMLERHPTVKPEDLELEILETTAINDLNRVSNVLTQCRHLGVGFALDDFGTGYSSLTYFQRLPIDVLKIDQSFVRDMLEDPNDLDIVESIVRLAQTFNRTVIAEGVETLEHGAMLIQLGCINAQGYGIARPMPADQMSAWIEQWLEKKAWSTINLPTHNSEHLNLIVAMQSHIHWLETLATYLNNPSKESFTDQTSHHCQFGRWYHSSGFARYGSLPEFQELDPLHKKFHTVSTELINLVNEGNQADALNRLPELYTLRDLLLTQIQILSDKLEHPITQLPPMIQHRPSPPEKTA